MIIYNKSIFYLFWIIKTILDLKNFESAINVDQGQSYNVYDVYRYLDSSFFHMYKILWKMLLVVWIWGITHCET